jgi:ribosome-binding factor A
MHPRRLTRLNELIQQRISEAVLDLKDPGLGFVTITGADTSPDVSVSKIYYSVLGESTKREETAQAFERARPHLRSELGKSNLRRVPQLIFIYDTTIERADRVTRLLNTIKDETPKADTESEPNENPE